MRIILPLFILALATGCSPKVRTQLIENQPFTSTEKIQTVAVIGIEEAVPESAKKIGSVHVFDGGLTLKCDLKTVVEKAQIEAINAGGNLLKITRHRVPGIMSSCHQIDADIYFSKENMKTLDASDLAKTELDSLPKLNKESPKVNVALPFQKYRISLNGGFSYLIGKTSNNVPSDFKQYVKELKSGSHLSIDGGYFWRENIGLGIKYSSFYSKNSINNIYITDSNGQTRYGNMSDNIKTQFIGAILYNRGYSKSRNTVWFANASLGYIGFKNNGTAIDKLTVTGSTLGASLDLGVDFKFTNNLYFGLGAGYTAGVLKRLKYNNGFSEMTVELEEGTYESMNRLDLSAGIRWAW